MNLAVCESKGAEGTLSFCISQESSEVVKVSFEGLFK